MEVNDLDDMPLFKPRDGSGADSEEEGKGAGPARVGDLTPVIS